MSPVPPRASIRTDPPPLLSVVPSAMSTPAIPSAVALPASTYTAPPVVVTFAFRSTSSSASSVIRPLPLATNAFTTTSPAVASSSTSPLLPANTPVSSASPSLTVNGPASTTTLIAPASVVCRSDRLASVTAVSVESKFACWTVIAPVESTVRPLASRT